MISHLPLQMRIQLEINSLNKTPIAFLKRSKCKKLLNFFVLFVIFSCNATKNTTISSSKKMKKVTYSTSYFANQEISREVALKNYIQSVYFYNKEGEIIENHKYTIKDSGNVLHKREVITLDKEEKPLEGKIYDAESNIVEYWVSEYIEDSKYPEIRTYDSKGQLIIFKHIYDNENGNKVENSQYTSPKHNYTIQHTYNAKNQLIEYLNFSSNGVTKRVFTFDEKGNQIEQVYSKPDGETLIYKYDFDKQNNWISTMIFDGDGNLKTDILYEYEFDQYGNWITQKSIYNHRNDLILQRKIEYFKN